MKKALKIGFLTVALALAVTAAPVSPVATAQDDGGIIVEATFGSGPANLNPLFCLDTTCGRVVGLMFPGLIGTDPAAATFKPAAPGSLAKEWSLAEDQKTLTFKLREDAKWSDGTPITTKDFLYSWEIIKNEEAASPYSFVAGRIATVEAPDDYTLIITLVEGSCDALWDASFPVAPSHVFADTAPTALKDHSFATAPTVSFGPFSFGEFRPGERTSLLADKTWPDAIDGSTKSAGFLYKVVPDQTVLIEQFLAGETSIIDNPALNRRADIKAAGDAGDAQVFNYAGNSWDYVALNLADPTNPQNGLDADGKAIDQGKHPIFGDVMVRRAIALGLDVDAMAKTAVFGEGTRMAANLIPTSYAIDPDLAPIPYDTAAAAKLLDDAGWVVGADGIREKDGVRLAFTLNTNAGNTRREAIVTLIKDQLAQIGVEVTVELIDFNLAVERLQAQTFDAIVLGWRNGYPDRPDQTQLFLPESDVVGSGSNLISWNNEEFNRLTKEARSAAGCDQEKRIELYRQAQKVFQDDLPYVPLFVQNGMYAARSNVKGFAPYQSQMLWNIDAWSVE